MGVPTSQAGDHNSFGDFNVVFIAHSHRFAFFKCEEKSVSFMVENGALVGSSGVFNFRLLLVIPGLED